VEVLGKIVLEGLSLVLVLADDENIIHIDEEDARHPAMDSLELAGGWPPMFVWRHGLTTPP